MSALSHKRLHPPGHPVTAAVHGDPINGTPVFGPKIKCKTWLWEL